MRLRREWGLFVFLALTCAGLCFAPFNLAPDAHAGQTQATTLRQRARVISVDNSQVRINLIIKTEEQFLTLRLQDGPHRGTEMDAINYLTGKMELDEFYESGQTILVEYEVCDGIPANARPRGVYRLHLQLALIVLFGLLLLGLAGWTGVNAILSFILSALLLWRVFLPLLLRGWPPIPCGLALTALMTAVITLAVGGLNRRGLAAFVGSMLGVLLTCGLAVLFTQAFHLNGAVRPFAETLLYSGYYELDLTRIFIASIFVASSGAVMDLAMDITTAMHEIQVQHPAIGFFEHIRSGLRLGRAVIGTMTTTLLLAYSASHITMFMLFIARGLPLVNIFNTPLVAAEILNILVGSFGLVTVAPFTVLVAGVLFRKQRATTARRSEPATGRAAPWSRAGGGNWRRGGGGCW
jgi:uncharacterized membrane protein